MLCGAATASGGTFTLDLASNVVGSYSVISPGACSTQRRLFCAKLGMTRASKIQTDEIVFLRVDSRGFFSMGTCGRSFDEPRRMRSKTKEIPSFTFMQLRVPRGSLI